MTVEADLFSRMSGFAGLAALVGSRIYPVTLQENCAFPAVTYHRVSSSRVSAMHADTGDVTALFQVNAWAKDPDMARSVAEQLRQALQRYGGTDTVTILQIFF